MELRAHRGNHRVVKFGLKIAFTLSVLFLAGCSNVVYKVTGDTMINFGQDKMLPYLLTTDDTKIGCVAGEALTPLMMSFGTVTAPPDELAVLIYMVGGACASNRAMELELEFLRLAKAQQVELAQDARIASKRWHGIAAMRQMKGYHSLVAAFGEPGGECPNFVNENQELIWILGNAVGLMAVMSDSQGGQTVGVPRDIAPKSERAAACLDTPEGNRRWWGMPKALRATLWTVVPGLAPKGADPWKELETAMRIGEEEGVRMANALAGLAAYNATKVDLAKDIIRRHADSISKIAANRDYQLIDIMATEMLEGMSDRMWTEAVGHRTPIAKFGTFWDDKKETIKVDIDIDDLL